MTSPLSSKEFLELFPNTVVRYIDDQKRGLPVKTPTVFEATKIPQGYGAFFTVNGFHGNDKHEKNLRNINGVQVDVDRVTTKEELLMAMSDDLLPTIINQTKNGFHCIWLLNEPVTEITDELVATVKGINRAICERYDGDKAATDVARLLRIPGTLHQKEANNLVEIKTVYHVQDNRYSLSELLEAYPPALKNAPVAAPGIFTDNTDKVLQKMLRKDKIKQLYDGNMGQKSEQDQAFCNHLAFWFGKDMEAMRSVWLQSPLGQREKVQKRKDYQDMTLSKAIASVTDVYTMPVRPYDNTESTIDLCFERKKYLKHLKEEDWENPEWVKQLKALRQGCVLAYHTYVAYLYPHMLYERGEDKTFWNYQEDEGIYKQMSFAEVRGIVIALLLKDDLRAEATETNVKNILNRYRAENLLRAVSLDDFITSGDWLHVSNGWLNVETLELEAHTPERLSLYKTSVPYDPRATCPLYDKFLDVDTVMAKDQVRVLDQYSGYILTPRIDQQKMLILEGRPGCGKSMLPEIWLEILGKKGTTASLQSLNAGEIRFMGDMFAHKQLCFFDEANPKTQNINEYFQNMVTKPYITVERKGIQEKVDVRNTLKMVLSLNEMPDHMPPGMERRYRHIIFSRSFTDEDIADPEYKNKIIKSELSGVLNRMLQGLHDLYKMRTFTVIEGETERKRDYSLSSDDFSAFLEEHFEPCNDGATRYSFQQMREAFVAEYPKNYHKQLSVKGFNKKLLANRLPEFKSISTAKSGGTRGYRGVRLKDGHDFSTHVFEKIKVKDEFDPDDF